MRPGFFLICGAFLVASCSNNSSDSAKNMEGTDTTGMAAFKAWKEQQRIDSVNRVVRDSIEEAALAAKKQSKHNPSHNNSVANSSSGTMTSESDNSAKTKKGWSKTAKGAVIGGVVGAGTGAAVNKKNRAAGAVIGGAVGAGAGAVIGHEKDKKDGRH